MPNPNPAILYQCGCCGAFHPWEYAGDCRDDENRFGDPSEYATQLGLTIEQIEVRTAEERAVADQREAGLYYEGWDL